MDRFTDRSRKVLDLALREALQLGHNYVAPEHILLGIIREGENLACRAFASPSLVRKNILALMRDELVRGRPPTVEERLDRIEAVLERLADKASPSAQKEANDG